MTSLFTPDPAEYSQRLTLSLDNTILPTTKNPKILGLPLDPKLTYNEHIKHIKAASDKTIKILKTLTPTHWGKSKETILNTYKTVTRPMLEYGVTLYEPTISTTQMTYLQSKTMDSG